MNLTNDNPEIQNVLKKFRKDVRSSDHRRLECAFSLYIEKKGSEEFKNEVEFHKNAIILGMKMGKDQSAENFAIKAAQACINLEPDNPKWYNELAYAYWWFQKPDLAISMAEQALSLIECFEGITDLGKSIIMGNLAYYYAETRRPKCGEKAKKLAKNALNINHEASTLDTLGYVFLRYSEGRDDLEQAKKHLEEALKISGEEYKSYVEKHLEELKEA